MGYYISKPEQVTGVCVYEHRKATTGEVFYIGQGKGERPWSSANRNNMWRSIRNKYGATVSVVAQGLTRAEADALEIELIAKHGRKVDGTGPLANITSGGGGTEGFRHSEDAKRRISEALRGIPQDPEFVKRRTAGRKGRSLSPEYIAALKSSFTQERRDKLRAYAAARVISEETRAKLSRANKGRKLSPSRVEAIRLAVAGKGNPMYGKTHTAEAREKIAAANRGRVLTAEHKAKINPTGRKHSEETKRKIGASQKGRVITQEQIDKIRRTKRDKGTPIRCVETGQVFVSHSDALDWLRNTQDKPKAQNQGLVAAMERRGVAYGYHWEFHPK